MARANIILRARGLTLEAGCHRFIEIYRVPRKIHNTQAKVVGVIQKYEEEVKEGEAEE